MTTKKLTQRQHDRIVAQTERLYARFPEATIELYLHDSEQEKLEEAIRDNGYRAVADVLETLAKRVKRDEKADVIVPIGNMAGASCATVKFDTNYEDMTEDFIDTFNHGVVQGMPPINSIYCMASAFAIVLGCVIRAGLPQAEVGKLLMMCGKNAATASKMVQIIQNQSVGSAVTDVIKASKRKVN